MGCFEKQARPWDVTKHSVDPDWNQIKVGKAFFVPIKPCAFAQVKSLHGIISST